MKHSSVTVVMGCERFYRVHHALSRCIERVQAKKYPAEADMIEVMEIGVGNFAGLKIANEILITQVGRPRDWRYHGVCHKKYYDIVLNCELSVKRPERVDPEKWLEPVKRPKLYVKRP